MINRLPPPVPPSAPTDLVAVAVGDGQVILAWSEGGAGGLGFRVERADDTGSACRFSEIGTTGAHVTAFGDGSVKPRTTYTYRVHAWNASGDSPLSNVAEVTTPQAGTGRTADGK